MCLLFNPIEGQGHTIRNMTVGHILLVWLQGYHNWVFSSILQFKKLNWADLSLFHFDNNDGI